MAKLVRQNKKTAGMTVERCKQPYTVIDSGATEDFIGGIGWKILNVTDRVEILSDFRGLGSCVLPKVDGVTAISDSTGKIHLIGCGNVTYDKRPAQYESLWNSHHLRQNKIIVNDVSTEHGGNKI